MREDLILSKWSDTEVEYPGLCLHGLFQAQVERTPDAIAVVFDTEELTYGALDRAADRVAHELRSLGVGPERLVGLCIERSLGMIPFRGGRGGDSGQS